MQVTIIQNKHTAALVEWVDRDGAHRCIIPQSEISSDKQVEMDVLLAGVPYGAPWAEIEPVIVSGGEIERALHNASIWTFDDLQANPKGALGALQAVFGVTLSTLYQLAKKAR